MHQVEKKELDEFEYLEHYADDNVSFLSNVSAINSALVNKKVCSVIEFGISESLNTIFCYEYYL